MPGCWAADLRFLDEAADHSLIITVPLEQELERQFAAQVAVAGLEHDTHAAAGDLAQDLVTPDGSARRGRQGVGTGPHDRRVILDRLGKEQLRGRVGAWPDRRQALESSGELGVQRSRPSWR